MTFFEISLALKYPAISEHDAGGACREILLIFRLSIYSLGWAEATYNRWHTLVGIDQKKLYRLYETSDGYAQRPRELIAYSILRSA